MLLLCEGLPRAQSNHPPCLRENTHVSTDCALSSLVFQATQENNLVCATANSPPASPGFCGRHTVLYLLNMPPSSYGPCPPESVRAHCSFPPVNTTASRGWGKQGCYLPQNSNNYRKSTYSPWETQDVPTQLA